MRDYHIHTTIRDGVHSIDENVEFAILKGLTEIGISEHFGILPDDWENYMKSNVMQDPEWEEIKFKKIAPFSMRGSLFRYFNYIDIAKDKYKEQIKVKRGIEMDLYRSNADYSEKLVRAFKPDYIIGSIHAFDDIGFHNIQTYFDAGEEDYKKILREFIYFIKKRKMDILGHYNLYKSFVEFQDESIFYPLYEELVYACKENNVAVEINTGCMGNRFVIDPELFFLKCCGKYDVPVLVTSDAHNKYNICGSFGSVFPYLRKAGVKYTASFTEGKMNVEEIKYDRACGWHYFPSMYVVW